MGVVETTAQITPSRDARMLFSAIMVALEVDTKELTMEQALALSEDRATRGFRDRGPFKELLDERWVAPTEDGGLKVIL